MSFDREDIIFHVVINDEDQYSIWPDYKAVPAGWRKTGFSGEKAACIAHIDHEWTDMRPRSLREAMEAEAAASET